METLLFAPDLYQPDYRSAGRLASDMRRIPDMRKTWSPATGPNLLDKTAIGTYDVHMANVPLSECFAWTHELKEFPSITLATDAPRRHGLVARGTVLLRSMAQVFSVPDTPFWHAVAELVFGFIWCIRDAEVACRDCVHGACSASMVAAFADYHHFLEFLPQVLDAATQRLVEYINHVRCDHAVDGPEYKIMDSCLMGLQTVYLDVLHPKANRMQFPGGEMRSIRYRLVNSGSRTLTMQVRLEQDPLSRDDDGLVDAVACAAIGMHDASDRRHDNQASEFYNLLTIVDAYRGVEAVDMVRRFCVDVWAWAIDHAADWAILVAGRILAWQVYMARYQTAVLFDHLVPPEAGSRAVVDPYGDSALNELNPLPRSTDPRNYDLRFRCQDKARYDRLLHECLTHFHSCPGCRGYDTASWQQRVPLIGAAYSRKYTKCDCLDTISTYMVLASTDNLWLAADPAAHYTGPTGEWSSMLC
ncbi:hypothetical protein DL766_006638 [Monosporascus sp. MC13-8B]|uniref:Uncharacterized protein n=1 Tax=Monosporascus cannonballus TaxID=155416 RepID=A0ABY0HHP0_9PEZI|nr:hypothetical protein DL763_008969 [Monosporascus cannonballus]RYO92046.1 hypothetical protein DL762_001875 [Monosporascus cannonballus]RYP26681.1 hypothetical protein DL766_006638 [Monosporascus sp. MC13-8B]